MKQAYLLRDFLVKVVLYLRELNVKGLFKIKERNRNWSLLRDVPFWSLPIVIPLLSLIDPIFGLVILNFMGVCIYFVLGVPGVIAIGNAFLAYFGNNFTNWSFLLPNIIYDLPCSDGLIFVELIIEHPPIMNEYPCPEILYNISQDLPLSNSNANENIAIKNELLEFSTNLIKLYSSFSLILYNENIILHYTNEIVHFLLADELEQVMFGVFWVGIDLMVRANLNGLQPGLGDIMDFFFRFF